jgi:hypothetical protein
MVISIIGIVMLFTGNPGAFAGELSWGQCRLTSACGCGTKP